MGGMVKFKSPFIAKGYAERFIGNIEDSLLQHFIEQGKRLSDKKGRDNLKEVRNIPVRYKEKYYNAKGNQINALYRSNQIDILYRIDFEGHDILICDIGVHEGDSEELSLTPEHLFEIEE